MQGPRAPLQNEMIDVLKFLDKELRPDQGWSISNEYPTAFQPANLGNIRVITDSEKVLSHAVIRPMILKSPVGLFKIAAIGSVVTSSEHRNQGLSSKIIESCIHAAGSHGCELAILWTNLHDFYRKFDFELAGTEISYTLENELQLPADLLAQISSIKIMESNKIAPEALQKLYSQHTVQTMRTQDEFSRYLQIPNSRVYTAWGINGTILAYAIEGKGADLGGYIHEWGGAVAPLMSLFAHIRKIQNRPIVVLVPAHAQNLRRQLESLGSMATIGFLGMLKIVNHITLFSKIHRYAKSVGVQDLHLEKRDGKFYFGSSQQIFCTDSERDLVRLFFGPQKAGEIHTFDPQTREKLEKIFPLPIWVWGWDSI